jgi:hypothetical protein
MASDVLDDQLSDLDVGGMGRVVDVEKSSVAVELKSVYAFLDPRVKKILTQKLWRTLEQSTDLPSGCLCGCHVCISMGKCNLVFTVSIPFPLNLLALYILFVCQSVQ